MSSRENGLTVFIRVNFLFVSLHYNSSSSCIVFGQILRGVDQQPRISLKQRRYE